MNEQIYLDKNISKSIKGILIILIVFGHNHVLCPNDVSGGLMEYFYKFHIAGFFILPFFYDNRQLPSRKACGNIMIRNWIPYLWICILCLFCLGLMKHHLELGGKTIVAFFMGTQTPIKHNFGFVFPWFLPTYCTMSILFLWAKKHKLFYWSLFFISLVLWGLSFEDFYVLKNIVPLGLALAIYYFGTGVLTFRLNMWSKYSKWVAIFVFAALSVCFWKHVSLGLVNMLFPVSFFLVLLLVAPRINCRFLRLLGENSLGIYLLHMFVVNVTFRLLPVTIPMGILGFLISLFVPLLINIMITRFRLFRALLYPRSVDELKGWLKKYEV